jgi:hypothetical protein
MTKNGGAIMTIFKVIGFTGKTNIFNFLWMGSNCVPLTNQNGELIRIGVIGKREGF